MNVRQSKIISHYIVDPTRSGCVHCTLQPTMDCGPFYLTKVLGHHPLKFMREIHNMQWWVKTQSLMTHSITSSHAWHVSCCICFRSVTHAWKSRSPSKAREVWWGDCFRSSGSSQSTSFEPSDRKEKFLFFWCCQFEAVSDAMQPTTTNRIHPRYRWCGVGLCGVVGGLMMISFSMESPCVFPWERGLRNFFSTDIRESEWPLWYFSSFWLGRAAVRNGRCFCTYHL